MGESSARAIFDAHQDAIAQWTTMVVDHQLGLELLLARSQAGTSRLGSKNTTTTTTATIHIAQTRRREEDALDLFPMSSSSSTAVDEETKRRALVAITHVLTEMSSLGKRVEDYDDDYEEQQDELLVLPQQLSQRLFALAHNLHLQLLGILQTPSLMKEKGDGFADLSQLTVVWKSLSRALASVARLEMRHKLVLLRHGLAQFAPLAPSTSAAELALLCDAAGKVLKQWIQSAASSYNVLECVCLFLYLDRVSCALLAGGGAAQRAKERAQWLRRLEQLFVQVSPNLPVVRQRRCLRAEDLLYDNLYTSDDPVVATRPPQEHFAALRVTYTRNLAAAFRSHASQLAHESLFAAKQLHHQLQVAQRLSHVVFNMLFSHVMAKLALPKDALPSLLLCMEALQHLDNNNNNNTAALTTSPLPAVHPNYAHLLPPAPHHHIGSTSRAIALNLCTVDKQQQQQLFAAECDLAREYHQTCSVRALFQGFPELFDPLLRITLDQASTGAGQVDLRALHNAFPTAAFPPALVKHVVVLVDSILRSRLVMRRTQHTHLFGLERQQFAVQSLLSSAPVSVRAQVELELAQSWHVLRTAGIDRSRRTYEEMQHMARAYFGLDVFVDAAAATVSAGAIDLLALAGGCGGEELFYTQFKYNLDFACFVERARASSSSSTSAVVGKQPQLRVVSLHTLRTCLDGVGLGALPTVVNLVYQHLAKAFSQLAAVAQQVKRYRKQGRAFRFFKLETALEQCAESQPIWAQMRALVTEIGNGFGLVRSLGLAVKQQQTAASQDSLGMLVKVFAASATLKDQLAGFFLLVPALCVEFVDANLQAKEIKPGGGVDVDGSSSTAAADDGFVFGIAALLAILQQETLFDSIKFFAGVTHYLAAKTATDAPLPAKRPSTTNATTTSSATFKMRHRGLAREYELVMYGLASARICFATAAEE